MLVSMPRPRAVVMCSILKRAYFRRISITYWHMRMDTWRSGKYAKVMCTATSMFSLTYVRRLAQLDVRIVQCRPNNIDGLCHFPITLLLYFPRQSMLNGE